VPYLLICQNCGQKHFTDGSNLDGLVEVKNNADLMKPNKEIYPLPRKFRCNSCGYLFKTTKIIEEKKKEIPRKEEELLDDSAYLKQWENECLRSIRRKKQS
jgi:hypothetical protein